MPQIWDTARTAADLDITGSSLIATRNRVANGANWQISVGTETFTTGDFYFEIVFTALNVTSNNATIGCAGTAQLAGTGDFVGDIDATPGPHSVGLASTGTAYYNNTGQTTGGSAANTGIFASYVAGQIVGVALHLAASGSYIAWRVGSAGTPGNWNNNVANIPATGAILLNTTVTAAAVGPAAATTNANATGDSFTGYFSSSSWQNTAPNGFSSFDAGVGAVSALETGAGLDTSTAGYLLTVSISEFA